MSFWLLASQRVLSREIRWPTYHAWTMESPTPIAHLPAGEVMPMLLALLGLWVAQYCASCILSLARHASRAERDPLPAPIPKAGNAIAAPAFTFKQRSRVAEPRLSAYLCASTESAAATQSVP